MGKTLLESFYESNFSEALIPRMCGFRCVLVMTELKFFSLLFPVSRFKVTVSCFPFIFSLVSSISCQHFEHEYLAEKLKCRSSSN